MSEVLYSIEKKEIIDSLENWIELREVRNELEHDYPSFGTTDIYLFGNRVDETKKGGDIDIAVDVNLSTENFKRCKIQFFLSLMKLGYDLKIDIVPYKNNDQLLTTEIKKNALKL